ncbi:unnamed protein product [Brachionus calyciflorus]|uniref:Uncharacterized protein n=1 Tax=Brachionus calyciflorus TaxID=104777 RepID=A0A814E8U5_9BILA|nr:unnamed protein product [Brachionus calyciflorus]
MKRVYLLKNRRRYIKGEPVVTDPGENIKDKAAQENWYVYCKATKGKDDFDLFSITFVQMFAASRDPYKFKWNQPVLRMNYNLFIEPRYLLENDSHEILD